MPVSDSFGLIGQVLDGHFRVERCIGEGGFSVVYKGTHIGLSEPIAIKCLKLPAALGSAIVESFIKRFRDESRLQYKLSQGNLHIVRSIASGTTIAPATSALVPYTVLEWLEGRSLGADFADRQARRMTGRSIEEVVRLLDSAIDALAYAHAQGVVHRDLNPGNLFLARTPAGVRLKVLDFGVAKVMADSALAMGPSARTIGNLRMFAPAYGAPEQFDERLGRIGPWTDVYSTALVALEAMRDVPIVEGEHIGEFAAKTLDASKRPTPRRLGMPVGDAVEAAFSRAVALKPADRPRDAGDFWGMLKHAIGQDARSASSPHTQVAAPVVGYGSTLRLEEHAPPLRAPIVEVVHPRADDPDAAARGGTLRVGPALRAMDAPSFGAADTETALPPPDVALRELEEEDIPKS
ncbi:MAG TPA: serine/threonine-protein kinase, partial [Polyangiaceae bacterium]|nr:serine/threonine-protein kinase [Polyangiaceae bacterium]